MLIDQQTGIIHRENTFDQWIVSETRTYFPLGLMPTDAVLDLGGHIGSFAARAMLECPGIQLSSLEAEQSNFAALEQNAAKFGFDAAHGAIVADELDGTQITLYVNDKKNNAAHSTVPTRGRSQQSVTGIGFSTALQEFKPTVIKCDIEGGEFMLPWEKIVQAPQLRLVVMELHLLKKGNRDLATKLQDKFMEWGYTCIREPKIGPKNWTTLAYWRKNA